MYCVLTNGVRPRGGRGWLLRTPLFSRSGFCRAARRPAIWRFASARIALISIAALLSFVASAPLTATVAHAQLTCPDVSVPSGSLRQRLIIEEAGTCVVDTTGSALTNDGIVISVRNFANGDFQVFASIGGNLPSADTLTCPGGNIVFSNIGLPSPGSCQLTAIFNAPLFANTVTVTATLMRLANGTTSISGVMVAGISPAPVPTTGLTAQDRSNITNSLFNTFNQVSGGIFDTDSTSIFGTGGPTTNGVSFVPTGLALARAPVSDDPFYLQYGGAPHAGQSDGLDVTTNAGFDFRLDLNGLRSHANARTAETGPGAFRGALGLNAASDATPERVPGTTLGSDFSGLSLSDRDSHRSWKPSAKSGRVADAPRFNAWVSGKYVDFDDDQQNADRSGNLWWVTSGMSYRVGERTTLGAFGRVRQGEVDSVAQQASLDSDFYGGGLFGVFTTEGGARLLLSGLYETSDSDISIQGLTGSFDADQWTVEAIVDKRFTMGSSWIEPSAKVFYTEADRGGYVDSGGNQIAGSSLTLGRFTAGPKVGTTITGRGKHIAEIRPFAKLAGVWDFESEGDFSLSTGAVFATSDSGLNVGGGVEVEFVRGTTLTLAGDWFGTNTELEGWSLTGGLGTSLAALGLGNVAPAGLVSLDFSASAEDQSAKAKLAIPLN